MVVMARTLSSLLMIAALLLVGGCSRKTAMFDLQNPNANVDLHSYAQPAEWRTSHIHLDLDVDFARKVLRGTARLHLERLAGATGGALMLDTRDLKVEKAEYTTAERIDDWEPAEIALGESDPILGAPLRVTIPSDARMVRVHYETSPGAAALQWLEPAQTAGRKQPFLFTQSQAIQARSWIPLQDSPGVRASYSANIRVPKPLVAVMSAVMEGPKREDDGDAAVANVTEYRFLQQRKIPAYLVALAVGDLAFANIDPEARKEAESASKVANNDQSEPRRVRGRTGIYAEPAMLDAAAREFEDTEQMIRVVEKRFGRYRWGRYDLLILPPSFPFGGMENPCLTFATPTVIAGDKSLVALVAHELAHSWSGNLVTNATWRDFWLNEGFTVYLERRIIEDLYGKERADLEAVLAYNELLEEMETLPPRDQVLYVDLAGRDPDEGFTSVPYEKGALFLTAIEQAVGRETFDEFLRDYFAHHSFHSITTQEFLNYLGDQLFRVNPGLETTVPVMAWLTEPGLPKGHPVPESTLLESVNREAQQFASGSKPARVLPFKEWSSLQQLRFLRALPKDLGTAKMQALDDAFRLTASRNAEVLSQWLLMAVRNGYSPANPRVERFLIEVGRRKFLKPLYEELVKSPEGRVRARAIYAKARSGYHPMAAATVDGILAEAAKQ
ncbi:MAG: M1 family metallopeptidase [Bryobacterales bacterium]|nr:M1 family metallopeptidase [Bryobacterales bacterium]